MNMLNNRIRKILNISLWLKGLFASTEIIGGMALYFASNDYLSRAVYFITNAELNEDPSDLIARYLINATQQLLSVRQFLALYLLSHGLVKIIAIAGLLKRKAWAFIASLVIFGAFIVYQIYRYYFTHSIWLLFLTGLDIFVVWLVWKDHKSSQTF